MVSQALAINIQQQAAALAIGRVGNYDVQIETTIEPVPRDAMIAVGTRIMETLAGK